MNSDSLHETYKEHYDELFMNSDLVLSLPYSISLFGGTASVFGGPIMNQPITHRGYIGFKKSKKCHGIKIISYKRICYIKGEMEQSKNDNFYAPSDIFLEKLSILFPEVHVEISILTEFESRNADIISGGVILGLDILGEKVDQKMIDLLKKTDCKTFYENIYVRDLLKRTLTLRLNYNESTIGGSSLDSFITGLIDSSLPILHMQEKHFYSISGETVNTKEMSKKVDKLGPIYITKRSEEFINTEFNKELPFDIMMFSLGDYRNIGWYQAFLNWGENSEQLKKSLIENDITKEDHFFIQSFEKNHLLHKSIEIISSYVFHVTKIFFDTILAKEKLGTFFFYLRRNIELINTLLGKYNLSSHEGEDSDMENLEVFLSTLYPNLQKNSYFIYTTGSSIELKYVMLLPKYLSSYSSEEINKELKNHFDKPVSLVYSSKNDGITKEGLRIEQFLQKDIFYKNSGEQNILLISHDGTRILFSNQDQAMEKGNKGILLDKINQKIFINGERINSKDLLSQNATVDTLSILLDNLGSEIQNSLLPQSGYSKNKNEMVSKIIIPLLKLVEGKFAYQLPLTCKGNNQEYYLKLEKPEIDIFIMKRREI